MPITFEPGGSALTGRAHARIEPNQPNDGSWIGANLIDLGSDHINGVYGPGGWGNSRVFMNAAKHGWGWYASLNPKAWAEMDVDKYPELDEDDTALFLFGTDWFSNYQPLNTPTQWTITYTIADGTLTSVGDGTTVSNTLDPGPVDGDGTLVLQVNAASNVGIRLLATATGPAFSLSALDIRETAYVGNSSRFWPPAMAKLNRFGAIRATKWNGSDSSAIEAHTSLPGEDECSYSDVNGPPLSAYVDLCNALGCHLWYNLPYKVNDAAVTFIVDYIEANLDSGLQLILELGNEVWNFTYADEMNHFAAIAAGQGFQPTHEINATVDMAMQGYGYRLNQVIDLANAQYASHPEDLIRIACTQNANMPNIYNALLDVPVGGGQKLYHKLDALGVAPYFYAGGDYVSVTFPPGSQGKAACLAACQADIDTYFTSPAPDAYTKNVYNLKKAADDRGLLVFAYESGSHLVALTQGVTTQQANQNIQLVIDCNHDPQMRSLIFQAGKKWYDIFGNNGFYMIFGYMQAWGKFGCWGYLEDDNKPPTGVASPKWAGAMDLYNATVLQL